MADTDQNGPVPLLLDLQVRADMAQVRATLDRIDSALTKQGIRDCFRHNVELALAELLNNIVEHAYRDRSNGMVCLHLALEDPFLDIALRDCGAPMPGGTLPPPKCPPNDGPLADLPEGGFGWYMLHALTDQLSYMRRDGVNHTRLRLRVAP